MTKLNALLAVIAFCFCSLTALAQPTFSVVPQEPDAMIGETVNVDVIVENFTEVVNFQFSLDWETSDLTYVGVVNTNPTLGIVAPPSNANFSAINTTAGNFGILWFDPIGAGVSLADSAVLFTVQFTIASADGNTSFVKFTNTPSDQEVIQKVGGFDTEVTGSTGFANGPATEAGYNTGGSGGGRDGVCRGSAPDPDPSLCNSLTGFALSTINDTVATGEQTCLDVSVCNFDEIVGMSYTIEFNPNLLQFNSICYTNLEQLDPALFATNNTDNGFLNLVWFDSLDVGVTAPDGSAIYSICFDAIGPGGSMDTLKFNNSLTPLDIVDVNSNGNHIGLSNAGGIVTITGSSGAALSVNISNESVLQGDNGCVDISVVNFTDITELDYSLSWDPSIIDFTGVMQTGALAGLSFDTSPALVNDGKLSVEWSGSSSTLADNAVLYSLCFDAVGNSGQASDITVTSDPVAQSAQRDNGAGGTDPVNVVTSPGSVNIASASGFQLLAVDTMAATGDTVCIPITTNGFNDIIAMTFAIQWDTSVLEYVSASIVDMPNQSILAPPVGDKFNVIYSSISGLGQSLGDGSVLLDVCFRVKGATGSSGDIEFVPTSAGIFEIGQDQGGSTVSIPSTNFDGTVTVIDNAIMIGASLTQISCNGADDGAIDLTISGGMEPYNYNWDFNNAVSEDISDLPPGVYNVTVTDDNGTTATGMYTITQPDAFAFMETVTDVDCAAGTAGAIDLTVTGGTGAYTYDWNDADATYDGMEDLTNLPVGGYKLVVTDERGCKDSVTYNIGFSNAMTLSASVTDITCVSGSDGAIDITVTGGAMPYNFDWNGADATYDGMQNISGLSEGTYDLTVTDANGCTATISRTLNAPGDIIVTFVVTDVTCNGGTDGRIDVTVTGGTMPYDFDWSNNAFDGMEDANGVGQGTLVLTVTDDNGCRKVTPIVVAEPTAVTVSATKTDLECNGDGDGTITLTVSGGTPGYTYAWSDVSLSGKDQTGLSGGVYDVTVSDSRGCTATTSVTVVEPSILNVTGAVVHESMPSAQDGSIDLTVNGGTAGYTIDWSHGPMTEDVSSLAPGPYSVTVTDANNCSMVRSFTINSADAPTITVNTTTNPSCNGFSNGSIDISVTGGTPGYNFMWSNGETTENLTNLPAGTYSLTVTDANMVQAILSSPIILTDPPLLTATASATDVSCSGAGDGSVTVSASGGTGGYTYIWSNAAPSAPTITGLNAAPYNVTVLDARGCSATAMATVDAPTGISVTGVSVTNTSCNGFTDGSIDITVAGGDGNYTFDWSNGTMGEDPTNLGADNYVVTITDGAGCSIVSSQIDVTEPLAIGFSSVMVTDVECNGQASGAIDIEVSGGTGAYTYAWSNRDGGGALGGSQDLTSLTGGNYGVTITDALGCEFVSNDIFVDEAGPITIQAQISPTSIANNDGSINLTVTGGTTPYNYTWFSPTGNVNGGAEDQFGLTPGFYFVTVVDDQGCVQTRDSMLVEGVLEVIPSVSNLTCAGSNDGSISLDIQGGIRPFRFAWSDGSSIQNRTGLAAGTYTVTITDAAGTEKVEIYTIEAPQPIVIQDQIVNETGTGCNGQIRLTIAGGTSPYTYQWSNGETTENLSNVCKGLYNVTVTDIRGCIATRSGLEVLPADLELASNPEIENASCFGATDGSVTIRILGGCPPYRFTASNMQFETTSDLEKTFSGFGAGNHSVVVEDANGSTETVNFSIDEPAPVSATIDAVTNNMEESNTECSGAISITPSGGTGPYTYQWSNGASSEDIDQLCEIISPYSVTITDSRGCTGVVSGISLRRIITEVADVRCKDECTGEIRLSIAGEGGPFSVSWADGESGQVRTNLCAGTYTYTITDNTGDPIHSGSPVVLEPSTELTVTLTNSVRPLGTQSNGEIDITPSGGWGGYTFQWNGPNNFQSTVEDPQLLGGGTYQVIVTDDNGCQVTLTVPLDAKVIRDVTAEVTNDRGCGDLCTGSVLITEIDGGVGPYTYEWSNGFTTAAVSELCEDLYTVTITDSEGLTGVFDFNVVESAPIELSFTKTNTSITVNVTGGTPPFTYQWNNENSDTTQTITVNQSGRFDVLVRDSEGCFATDGTETVIDLDGMCSNVRAIITPNSDGDNDNFVVRCDDTILNLRIQIFNRWGQLVFESDDYQNEWQGTNRRGESLPEGGYFYVLEYTNPETNQLEQEKGHISIIR
ncbi:MAG: gliding motility-associated C-terminal domain-containing protein [Bacteroidota bacterium]